jgi:hypothetical protein
MQCLDNQIMIQGRLVRIAHLDTDRYDPVDSPDDLIAQLRQQKSRIDLFTFMQIMPETERRYDYPMEVDNLAILPVSSFEHWWNKQIRSYPRNRARQAEKRGVVLREVPFDDALVEGIQDVYNETRVRQGRPNKHFGKDLETVRREAATFLDRSIFIGAFFEEKLIGFVKLVVSKSGAQAGLMNIVAMIRHRDKAPTNALIAHSVRACADRAIPYLMYQSFTYGNKEADSVTHFKEINGFECVNLPRYYVPLTSFGAFALKHGLQHKLMDRLPKDLAVRLRQMRNAWYNRRLPSESEAS